MIYRLDTQPDGIMHDTGFLKITQLKALNIPFKKVVLPERVKFSGTEGESGGSWLPEEKK